MRITIELEVSTDSHPDTGISVPVGEDEEGIKLAVYTYLQELMEDDSLSYTVSKVAAPKTRNVWYCIEKLGDGSAHPVFFATEEEADAFENEFCEAAECLTLVVGEDGLPYLQDLKWNGEKYEGVLL